jgi:phosphoserine phosphatase
MPLTPDSAGREQSPGHPIGFREISPMDQRSHRRALVAAAAALAANWLAGFSALHAQTMMDPLPSWEDGEARSAVLDFVASVTTEGSSDYVEPDDRIAVFDNDGTLWVEQPVYTQGVFLLDRLRTLAKDDPTLAQTPEVAAILKDDLAALTSLSETDVAKLISLTGMKMASDAYRSVARQWLATTRHKRWDRPYTELVYQPMIEMMRYLRSNGFTVFIVSGGGTAFMRAYADRTYGVHPDNVVGSTIRLK